MKIYVKGINGALHTLDIKEAADISVLRQRLEELEGIPREQLVMVYAGKELEDGFALKDYGIGGQVYSLFGFPFPLWQGWARRPALFRCRYNIEHDAMIYLQMALQDPVRIYLAAPTSNRPRICEVVEADTPLEEVLRLLWAHGLVEKFDPENCQVVAKRDDGTTIVAANFEMRHTVDAVMRTVSRIEDARVTVTTFTSAPDGNLHVQCTPTSKPYENTHL